jgi:membrane-associated protease RseP (regulator of RpoE activity)
MAEDYNQYTTTQQESTSSKKNTKSYLIHAALFIVTFITSTIAGVQWTSAEAGPYELKQLLVGLPYSISIMLMISFHEFGHYFAAKYHKVKVTLPFYIPFPPIPYFINFGTMGAVIRTKSPVKTKKAMFDIGVAGPIAGFIFCIAILIYGFLNLPGEEYILTIHPDYFSPEYGKDSIGLVFGDSILFSTLKWIFVNPGQFFPPMSEIYHYPYLCVGWFGLLITSMNLIPVGQLDGGHISYSLFGKENHFKISIVAFSFLFIFGIAGLIDTMLEFNYGIGWAGWLFWSLVLYFVIKLKHPPIADNTELDNRRKLVGYFSLFILLISFSPTPIMFILPS